MFRNKKRLFTFGCSFTNYNWNYTWPEILKVELGLPLYNYGKIGVGNQYIFNTVMQADIYHKFTKDDLIMICWSGVHREDRYAFDKWHHTSNVFYNKNEMYGKKWIKEYCDPNGMALRDYALFKSTTSLLKQSYCESYQMSMNSLTSGVDKNIVDMYRETLDNIRPSFLSMLWQDDWNVKKMLMKDMNPIIDDYHPSPIEHLIYLTKTFNYKFSNPVIYGVSQFHNEWESIVKQSSEPRFIYKPYNVSQNVVGYI